MITKRIEKAINIFLDAINEGTLAKGSCYACAVGNLVAHGMNGTYRKTSYGVLETNVPNACWTDLFSTSGGRQTFYEYQLTNEKVVANIEATDFTYEELMQIEYAFETATHILNELVCHEYTPQQIRADQIKGLEAVVKVMLEFDECKDNVREVFTKKAKALVLN